jgi:hypothetical protein
LRASVNGNCTTWLSANAKIFLGINGLSPLSDDWLCARRQHATTLTLCARAYHGAITVARGLQLRAHK